MEPLVVRGAWWGWRLPTLAAALGAGAVALASILALSRGDIPWSILESESFFSKEPLAGACVVAFVFAASGSLAKSFFRPRAGRVVIDDDGVFFTGLIGETRVAWSALTGYSDASSARIDLRRGLAIPTRDDATRAAVLAALDARGLKRVEIPTRARAFARAIGVGLVAVGALLIAVGVANRRWRTLHELAAGKPADDAAARAVADSLHFRWTVRSPVGADDQLVIDERCLARAPGFFVPEESVSFMADGSLSIDGGPAEGYGGNGSQLFFGGWGWLAVLDSKSRTTMSHHMAPGRHEVRVLAHVTCRDVAYDLESRTTVEVVAGSLAPSRVKLVGGVIPDVRVDVNARNGVVAIRYANVSPAVAARVECIEDGKTLACQPIIIDGTGATSGLLDPRLGSGHHSLTFRFTPDVPFAYQNDVLEIHGETFERLVEVDLP